MEAVLNDAMFELPGTEEKELTVTAHSPKNTSPITSSPGCAWPKPHGQESDTPYAAVQSGQSRLP